MATKVFTYSPQIWKTWRSMCQLDLPSGKLSHNELERSTIFNGKTHYYRTAGPGELGTVDGERQRWHQWGHHPFLQAVVLSTLADGVQGWMASLSILSSTRMADSQCQKKMGSFGFIWDDILLFLRLGCGFQPAKIGFQAQTCHFQHFSLMKYTLIIWYRSFWFFLPCIDVIFSYFSHGFFSARHLGMCSDAEWSSWFPDDRAIYSWSSKFRNTMVSS